jgi:hypothetical protein
MFTSKSTLLSSILCASLFATAGAQQDAPPPDIAQLLKALKALKDQQAEQAKSTKQRALQEAQSAGASPSAAAAAWVESIRQTQFEGAEKEGAQFREWREKEGAAFADREVQTAAQLYFRWLALTLRRSMGATPRELLPEIVQYTKDAAADRSVMDSFVERSKKEKEMANSRLHGARRDKSGDDNRTQRVHDLVVARGLAGSAPVRAMRMEDLIKVEQWELTPGNVEGIFSNIVLPELRTQKDSRVFEYWDMRIKKEADLVKDKPAYDQEKFTKERRPNLLWNRAQEYLHLGQRNRAIAEMFQILKTNPQHPSLAEWIGTIEQLLAPPAPVPAAAVSSAPTATAPPPLPGAR